MRHEQPISNQLVVEPRSQERFERLSKAAVDLTIQGAVEAINEAAGIPERSLYGLPAHRRRRGTKSRKKDLTASRTRETMARRERTPAARNWSTRLPVV